MRECHIAEKVQTLRESTNLNLPRMEPEPTLLPEPLFDERDEKRKIFRIFMENHGVIRISEIMPDTEPVFDKMIKCIQIDIREQLARQIADRDSAGLKSVL